MNEVGNERAIPRGRLYASSAGVNDTTGRGFRSSLTPAALALIRL